MPQNFTTDFVNNFFLKHIPVQNKDYQYSIIIIIYLAHLCNILKDNTKALEILKDFINFIDQKEALSQRLIVFFDQNISLNNLSIFFGNENNIYLDKVSFISILMLAIVSDSEKEALDFIEKIVENLKLEKEFELVKNSFNGIGEIELSSTTNLDKKIYTHIFNHINYRNQFTKNINSDKWNKIKNSTFEYLNNLSKVLKKYNYNINDFDSYKKVEIYLKSDINKEEYLSEFIILNIHIEKLFDNINNIFDNNKKEFYYQLEHIKKLDSEKNEISKYISEFRNKIDNESNNIRNYSVICINKIIERFNEDLSKTILPELSKELSKFKKKEHKGLFDFNIFNDKNDNDLVEFAKIKLNNILLNWIETIPVEVISNHRSICIEIAFKNLKEFFHIMEKNFNIHGNTFNILKDNLFSFEYFSLNSKDLYDFEDLKNSIKISLTSAIPGVIIFLIGFLFPYLRIVGPIISLIGGYMGFSISSNFSIRENLLNEIGNKFKENKIDEKISLSIKNEIKSIFDSLATDFENSFSNFFNEMEYQFNIVTEDYNNYIKCIEANENSIKDKIINLELDISKIQLVKENLKIRIFSLKKDN